MTANGNLGPQWDEEKERQVQQARGKRSAELRSGLEQSGFRLHPQGKYGNTSRFTLETGHEVSVVPAATHPPDPESDRWLMHVKHPNDPGEGGMGQRFSSNFPGASGDMPGALFRNLAHPSIVDAMGAQMQGRNPNLRMYEIDRGYK